MNNTEFITSGKLIALGFEDMPTIAEIGIKSGVLTKNGVNICQNGDDFMKNQYTIYYEGSYKKVQTIGELKESFQYFTNEPL